MRGVISWLKPSSVLFVCACCTPTTLQPSMCISASDSGGNNQRPYGMLAAVNNLVDPILHVAEKRVNSAGICIFWLLQSFARCLAAESFL